MSEKAIKPKQEMIYGVAFYRSRLPEDFKAIKDSKKALAAYGNDLFLQLKTKDQVIGLLLGVCANEKYITNLVEDISKNFTDKQQYFEQLVLRGLGLALQQQNLNAYYKGMSLLKDVYGISKNIVATVKAETATLSEDFFALKEDELKN